MGRLAVVAIALAACPRGALAHGMRSAYLEVEELDGGRASLRLTSNLPATGLALLPPEGCRAEEGAPPDGSLLVVECPGGLAGRTLRIDGIGPLVSDVVVRATPRGGATSSHVLTAAQPEWRLPRESGSLSVLAEYARMGLAHIFTGWDHLLFLAALAVALKRLRAILVAETAFTASHTLTFTASSLGWVHVSSVAAEACIALSLVLIALDAAQTATAPATASAPAQPLRRAAALAFAFGLVHGLGFAGGLAEIGLPDRAIGWALAGFAAGVELGQVAFLIAFVGGLALAARARRLSRLPLALAYAVGSAGAFLFFVRIIEIAGRS